MSKAVNTWKYYTKLIGNKTILEHWNEGAAHGDSITPSAFSAEYRQKILDILISYQPACSKILSIGSGNGFTESLLFQYGYEVHCIDPSLKSVELCISKGLSASVSDFYSLSPDAVMPFDVIYMDGVMGHLIDSAEAIERFINRIKIITSGEKSLLISNDSFHELNSIVDHKVVDGYCCLPDELVHSALKAIGFSFIEKYIFQYERPVSGARMRSIYLCRFG